MTNNAPTPTELAAAAVYAERCERATTAQGLNPIVAAIDAAGFAPVVEHTGGYMMCVVVTAPGGRVVVTEDGYNDAEGPGVAYAVGAYFGDAWDTCEGPVEFVDNIGEAGAVAWALAAAGRLGAVAR
jgi:hypothetical protein